MMAAHDDHDHDHAHEHDSGHSHGFLGHHRHHHRASDAPAAILRAMGVTIVFMLIELAGGWWANSLALISDGAHMLTDVGAMLLSLFAVWVSRRPTTSTMSFGYHRAEILGALASGLSIWLIAGLLVYESVSRMTSPPEVKGAVVFAVASIGLCANLLSMRMLRHAKEDNVNARAAYLHMLSDSLGSVGAIVAGLVLWLTGWRPIDPIISIVFSLLMLISSWELVKETVGILMESAPTHIDPDRVRADLKSLAGVREVHDLHIWSVTSGRFALSVHLISSEAPDGAQGSLLTRANELLRTSYGIQHTTIQIEHPDRFRSEQCYDCAPPDEQAGRSRQAQ